MWRDATAHGGGVQRAGEWVCNSSGIPHATVPHRQGACNPLHCSSASHDTRHYVSPTPNAPRCPPHYTPDRSISS